MSTAVCRTCAAAAVRNHGTQRRNAAAVGAAEARPWGRRRQCAAAVLGLRRGCPCGSSDAHAHYRRLEHLHRPADRAESQAGRPGLWPSHGLVLAIRAGRRALPSGALLNTSTNSGAGTSSAAWEQPLVHRLGAVVDGRAIASPNSIETVEFNADVVVFCPWLGALRLKGLVLSLKERSERRCRCEAPVCTLLLCAPALDVPFRIPAAVSSGPLGRTALFCAHRSRIQTRHWMAAGQVPLAL